MGVGDHVDREFLEEGGELVVGRHGWLISWLINWMVDVVNGDGPFFCVMILCDVGCVDVRFAWGEDEDNGRDGLTPGSHHKKRVNVGQLVGKWYGEMVGICTEIRTEECILKGRFN